MKKITPFLWFDNNAEEAVNFYVSIFNNSSITKIGRLANGAVISATFVLDGQEFIALNGGPHFKFTEAISFFVDCVDQKEVDELWEKLSEGGEKGKCGWLKDKYGISWQIIPSILGDLIGDADPVKSHRAMEAMLQMEKINIAALKKAHEGN